MFLFLCLFRAIPKGEKVSLSRRLAAASVDPIIDTTTYALPPKKKSPIAAIVFAIIFIIATGVNIFFNYWIGRKEASDVDHNSNKGVSVNEDEIHEDVENLPEENENNNETKAT